MNHDKNYFEELLFSLKNISWNTKIISEQLIAINQELKQMNDKRGIFQK